MNEIIICDIYHNNNKTIHPFLAYINDHEIQLSDKYYNDDYGNCYNFEYHNNALKRNHIRWVTFKSFKNNRIGIPQKNLHINIDNYNLIKSVNLHLKDYKNFDNYINSISKNLKRDYLRALNGEKNRDIMIYDINHINNLLQKYFESNINLKNEEYINYINKYSKIKVYKKPIYYGYYLMLDDLLKNNIIINKEFKELSNYIRIKFNFCVIKNIFNHLDDINEIINECDLYYKTNSYNKYKNLFKNNKQIVNLSDEFHFIKYYGVFLFDKLISFISIHFDGELSGICIFLTNPKYNKYSCVPFLICNIIKDIIENHKCVKIINYWINNCKGQENIFNWKKKFRFKESCILCEDINI